METAILDSSNPMTINYNIPIWGIFLFVIGACLSLIKIYVDYNRLKDRVVILEADKAASLAHREISDRNVRNMNKTLTEIKIMLKFILGDKIPKGLLNEEEEEEK